MALNRIATQATWLLSQAHARAHGILVAAFAEAGVRGYHYRLMAALAQYGPTSQAELGRHTGLDRSDVATSVSELDAWDFTRREVDPADSRRKLVTLTPAGSRRLKQLDRVLAGVQATVLTPLTPSEQRQFVQLLAKMGAEE